MTTVWYEDPAIWEYLWTDSFWVLAIFIAVNGGWTFNQNELLDGLRKKADNETSHDTSTPACEPDAAPNSDAASPDHPSPNQHHSVHRQPLVISSRTTQYTALLLAGLIVPLQLLEGYWVLMSAWRFNKGILVAAWPQSAPYIAGLPLFLVAYGAAALITVVVAGFGTFFMVTQWAFLRGLWQVKPGYRDMGEENHELAERGEMNGGTGSVGGAVSGVPVVVTLPV